MNKAGSFALRRSIMDETELSEAPNENIDQNHLNIELLNVF